MQDIASPSTRITPHRGSPSILFISEYQFCLVGRFQISMIHGPVPKDSLKTWLMCFYEYVHWFAFFFIESCSYWNKIGRKESILTKIGIFYLFGINFSSWILKNNAQLNQKLSLHSLFFRVLIPQPVPFNFFFKLDTSSSSP